MSTARDRWETEYESREVEPADRDPVLAPVLSAALDHFGDIQGRRLLDLGCGTGGSSLYFAARGASVVSVDTSETAIRNLATYCADRDITNVEPLHLSAQNIRNAGQFDLVFGSMILHHIEPFDEFVADLRTCLVPGGKAFFYENSAGSPLLVWFRERVVGRFWIPKHGDHEEFPLTPKEVHQLRAFFHVRVIYPEFLFFQLAAVYFLRGHWQAPFVALDRLCYRLPFLRKYSYRQYLLLTAA